MQRPLSMASLVIITIALPLATFMQVLDTSIANVVLPAIAGDFGVSPNQATWVITSFAASNAIALPLSGWLARRFGEVRTFVGATLMFTLVSWLCGLATSLPMLVFLRVVQGAVAGPMIPLSQSLLLANYPQHLKGMALAFTSMTVVVAPIFGPIVGGWITDNISWPWIFYINIPIGLLSAYLGYIVLRERETPTVRQPIDAIGFALLVIGVGSLQVLLDKGNELDWFGSPFIVGLGAVAVVALAYFVTWELTDRHPVVDLTLFRERNFTIGAVAVSLGFMVLFGSSVIFPLWLQPQMGYTATWAGFAVAPIGFLTLLLSPVVGRTMHRVDPRLYACTSFLVFALVMFWMASFTSEVSFGQLVPPRLTMGIGLAFFFAPLIMIQIAGLDPARMASALGLANFLRVLAGSFGASLSITLWDRREAMHFSQLVEHISLYDPAGLRALERMRALGMGDQEALAQVVRGATGQAYMLAINDVFMMGAWICLALFMLVWFSRPPFSPGAKAGAGAGAH